MKIDKNKAKRVAILFYGVGAWGITMSIFLNNSYLLFLAGINITLGIIFSYIYKKSNAQ
jgi:hypothetical protein